MRDPASAQDVTVDSPQDEVWTIFDDSRQRLPEWEVQRARALALCEQAVEEVNPQFMRDAAGALQVVLSHDANDVEALRSLGFLYGSMGDHANAARLFEAALQADPQDEISLKNLGLVAYRARSLSMGLRSYQAYLRLNAWDPTIFGPYVSMLAASGDLHAAVKTAERGLQLDPTERELRRVAARLYERIGDGERSRKQQQLLQTISDRLDPWDQKRHDRQR